MTISQCVKKGVKILEPYSKTPLLDSEILLSHILRQNKAYLISRDDESITTQKEKEFFVLVNRRSRGVPIAYLICQKEFYSLPFYVSEAVLIPRPETEQLVDLALEVIFQKVRKLKKGGKLSIIDVGTGSGNIGITLIYQVLKRNLNKKVDFMFYLTDISGKALNVARKNFERLIRNQDNIKVYFVKADLLKGFDKDIDVIVSNPPYIPRRKIEFLEDSVKDFEPTVALNGGIGGIEILNRLIRGALRRLKRDGVLLFEIFERHPNQIKFFLLEHFPWGKVKFLKDSFGEWRFCVIKLKIQNSKLKTRAQNAKRRAVSDKRIQQVE